MTQSYGNISKSLNSKRLSGISINNTPVDLSAYLDDEKQRKAKKLEDNRVIDKLVWPVLNNHLDFSDDKILNIDKAVKLLKEADRSLKNIVMNDLTECKSNTAKIAKILVKLDRYV